MQKTLLLFLSLLFAATTAPAATLLELVADLSSDDYDQRQAARLDLRQKLADAGQKELSIFEVELLEFTKEDYPSPTRQWVIRMLELFGSQRSVDRLAQLLQDEDPQVRDCARRALVANPDASATAALESALKGSSGVSKASLMDALAYRGATTSVPAIAAHLASSDPEVVRAALLALGKIGGKEARKALLDFHQSLQDSSLKASVERALLEVQSGPEVTTMLAKNGQDDAIRVAAFDQLLTVDSVAAKHLAQEALGAPEMKGRSSILRGALESGIRDVVVSKLGDLPEEDQLLVLGAVSDQRLSLYEKPVLELLPQSQGELRDAVILTLGRIGSEDSFQPLYSLYLEDSDNESLSDALSRLRAPEADATLMRNARDDSDPAQQVAAFQLLALRNTPGATELANDYAAAGNPDDLRKAAFSALERIGNIESVKTLLAAILAKDSLMRDAQRSLKRLSVNMGIPEYQWEEAYQPALELAADDEARRGILAILDGVSCESTAQYLSGLAMNGSDLKPDAIRSLSRWSDISAGEIWLQLATQENADEATIRTALRGLKRILTTESVVGDGNDKVDLAVRSIEGAPTTEFKKEIIVCYTVDDPNQPYDEAIFNWSARRELRERLPDLVDDPVVGEIAQSVLDYVTED